MDWPTLGVNDCGGPAGDGMAAFETSQAEDGDVIRAKELLSATQCGCV